METNNTHIIPEEIIISYLAGDVTDADLTLLLTWINESDNNRKLFLEIRDTYLSLDINTSTETFDSDAAFNKFIQQTSFNAPVKQRNIFMFVAVRVAAIFMLALATYYFFTLETTTPIKSLAATTNCMSDTLADGSIIALNKQSTLSYPETFASDKREVCLTGEAFFIVSKNKAKPFIINVNDFHVKVVGTSFNVKANPSDNQVVVTIETGHVICYYGSNENTQQHIDLKPGDQGIYNKITHELTKTTNTNYNYNTWSTGQLIFKNSTMLDILKEVENTCNVHFVVADTSIYKCKFTGKINTQSQADLYTILETALNIKLTPNNNTILITGKGCE